LFINALLPRLPRRRASNLARSIAGNSFNRLGHIDPDNSNPESFAP
jgi:hypothetical protein